MATELAYLQEFDVVSGTATITKINTTENGRVSIALDTTSFYPRGGGQDWDTGEIMTDSALFNVEEVRLDQEGEAWHIGAYVSGSLIVGDQVDCQINVERRSVNTKLHSAGHLIDMAVSRLQLPWIADKGAHYTHMSFVEYNSGDIPADEAIAQAIKDKIAELLQSKYQNKILFVPVDEMSKYCQHVPGNMPTNKPSRIVLYADDFGIPCGGTHVRTVHDIGGIVITKIKTKGSTTKVSYAITGINC